MAVPAAIAWLGRSLIFGVGRWNFPSWAVDSTLSATWRPSSLWIPVPPLRYPFFSGYCVDPLLKKEVFTMENQLFPKIPGNTGIFE